MKLTYKFAGTFGAIALLVVSFLAMPSFAQSNQKSGHMYIDFECAETTDDWRVVNDGVMGGRSSGGLRFEDGVMIFEGVINTNGGGFSSVRRDVEAKVLSEASGVSLRVKSDGRSYKVSFRTNAKRGFRPISFQAEIPQTPIGEWAEVTVPFETISASIFGRSILDANFDKSKVWEMGLIIADGQDGPFHLKVDWIKAY